MKFKYLFIFLASLSVYSFSAAPAFAETESFSVTNKGGSVESDEGGVTTLIECPYPMEYAPGERVWEACCNQSSGGGSSGGGGGENYCYSNETEVTRGSSSASCKANMRAVGKICYDGSWRGRSGDGSCCCKRGQLSRF